MKVDTSRLKKGTSEVPPECQILIDKLKSCSRAELIEELSKIETWTFGKCELYHWIDILDIFDEILEEATQYEDNQIYIACDSSFQDRKLLLLVLNFTTLLIEHSFSRHLYNSVEHLTQLLLSTDLEIILGVLNLLYMFSKRSNFISRLSCHKKNTLLSRLKHIAEPYGGKECGFGLADCCHPDKNMPKAIYHFYYEYYTKNGALEVIDYQNISRQDPKQITVKLWKELDQHLDDDQKYHLFARARLATAFWNYDARILFVQARLRALSILVYSDALMGYTSTLIYQGFLEELVELLELQETNLVEIRAAALRTLTAIIHLERNSRYQRKSESRLNTIIEVTGASSYHGFLPTLVRNCIANLTLTGSPSSSNKDQQAPQQQPPQTDENLFPLQLATALFSFLYHLASYEAGAESLVSCGMMESLLRVINWSGTELEHITFVTRAVRVIDLITNLDMQSFQLNNGLNTFIKRLNLEVNLCRKEQSYEIKPNFDENSEERQQHLSHQQLTDEHMDTGSNYDADEDVVMTMQTSITSSKLDGSELQSQQQQQPQDCICPSNRTCLPQRAALLKSMLNFLKKAIQDSAFSDSIRHIMEGSLPESLKHIISNAEYYGPSLFLLATDVVTVYVFQEPSLLSSLQDNGLTDVVLQALLKKDVPATREVLGSLPNVFSALCLNNRGLENFVKYNPFDKLFRVLTSPVYLSAMRRRRSSDPMGDTASNIGNAMDELMRNQPSLKTPAIKAIIKLLEEIVDLGTDPKYVCWRAQSKNDVSPTLPNSRQNNGNNNDNGGSSDEDDEDEEEVSTSSHNQTRDGSGSGNQNNQPQSSGEQSSSPPSTSGGNSSSQIVSPANTERIPIALIDYTLNTMKFLEAILSNNSTDDHCREFVALDGLKPLLMILGLPNFPVTSCNSPITATGQAVASVCKSILNLTHEHQVLQEALEQLSQIVEQLKPLQNNLEHTSSSVLLKELANCPDINQAFINASYTPLLHAMSAVHGCVVMLVHVCRTGQSDIRTLTLMKWGQDHDSGIKLLKKLVMLYTALVWESTLLLALCTDDIIPPGSEFGKDEMEKLGASDLKNISEVNWDEIVSNLSVMENLSTGNTQPGSTGTMEVDTNAASTSSGAIPRKPKQDPVRFIASQSQLKYIKSLLGASSRLGRALAELFGLLVKLCVGSPLRQRRGQTMPPAPAFTTPSSRDIARILSFILVDGLSFSKLPASPVPKLKLTFLICSIGFTSPMLFDEKRYAYHLMLQKFIEEGGLEAFFEMFRWTLTAGYTIPLHKAIEHPNLPDGTGEALDAWLMLLEKMVNIRSIIESPHVITSKNSRVKQEFDAKHYLTYMHRHAFTSIQNLWGYKPLKTYGSRMTESMLSILKHIIKGEKVLQSKYCKNEVKQKGAGTSSSSAGTSSNIVPINLTGGAASSTSNETVAPPVVPAATSAVAAEPPVNQEHLRQLMDMGFSREHCQEALIHCLTVEQATDYLLNNPFPSQLDAISDEDTTSAPANPANMDIDVAEDEQVIRAILLSLGDSNTTNATTSSSTQTPPAVTPTPSQPATTTDKTVSKIEAKQQTKQKEIMKKYLQTQPLPKKDLDDFTGCLLKTCLNILDQLPDTVYKVGDLLITVVKRNGPAWRDEMLDTLCKSIFQCIQNLIQVLVQEDERCKTGYKEKSEKLISSEMAQKTAVRIHLFTLFFEGQYQEMKVPCALALKSYNIVPRLIKVLTEYQMFATIINKVLPTPKWLAPLALLLDLYDKVAMSTRQKQQMHKISTRTWQWYDIGSSKWNSYTPLQNKQINDAYQNGETEIRLVIGRNRYTINFNCMSQINDETANHRAIIMALRSIEKMSNSAEGEGVEGESGENSETPPPKKEDLMDVDSPAKSYAKLLADIELEPLSSFVPEEIVSSCVQLMAHQQLDRDTLHAIMRVVVRLTKNYSMAEVFARFGGIDVLLSMKHNCGYVGFTTLATLLIRHVIEEPKTLSLAMQNVIANRTLTTIPAGHRELLFLVRQLSSAVYRNPELFKEAALKVLKVDFDSMKRSQITDEKQFIMKSQVPPPVKYNMEHNTAMTAVCKLLKALVELEEPNPQNPESGADPKNNEKQLSDKPLLNKSAILRILAESVRSYQTVALYITEHVYRAGLSPVIQEDTTALSFILDKMFHINDFNMDRDCPQMAQTLIASIASSDVVQAQYTVVQEVKNALQRALNEPETSEKHFHIEGLATLIPSMIENNVLNIDNSNQFFKINNHTQFRQNIFYIMVEKGIITDIARAVQYLELGGPNTTATINHLLKPLEMLLRLTNEPMPALPSKLKKAFQSGRLLYTAPEMIQELHNHESSQQQSQQQQQEDNVDTPSNANLNPQNQTTTATTTTTTTTTDSTNAQDEQMADDSEQNTERDMSSAAIDSLVGENELGDHMAEVHLNEILDTLISEDLGVEANEYEDEDGNQEDEEDNSEDENDREHEQRSRHIHHHRENVDSIIVRETLDSSSDDSDSNPSENDEREMDEVGDDENDEDEEEEEAEERSELDVDEETQPFIEMYDHHMYGRHLSPSIPEIERDREDILVVQYSTGQNNGNNANNANNDANSRNAGDREATLSGNNIGITVSNNAGNSGNASNEQQQNFFPFPNPNFPMLYNENSEQGGNENSNSAQGASSNQSNEPSAAQVNANAPPNNHPLLSGGRGEDSHRHHDHHLGTAGGAPLSRSTNRPRRYQFISISSRNQPVILQRLLGPNNFEGAHVLQNAGTSSGTGRGNNGPFSFRGATRVVVMDNGFNILSNGGIEHDVVDQSGYWFGRTLANHLNNQPSALCWWQEENKISGPDSNSDLCMIMSDEMIPELEAARANELSKIRGKRKRKPLEDDDAKQKNQEKKPADDKATGNTPMQAVSRTMLQDFAPGPMLAQTFSQASTVSAQPSAFQNVASQEAVGSSQPAQNEEQQARSASADMDNVCLEDVEIGLARLVGDNPQSNQNMEENGNENVEVEQMSFMEEEDEDEEDEDGQQSPPQSVENIQSNEIAPAENISRTLDGDIEMTSDAEESSASANNSRSFSPNYSPNHQQAQPQSSDLNMLNRESSSGEQQSQTQQPQMNIQQQEATEQQQQDTTVAQQNLNQLEDHHMRGDTDADSESEEDQNVPRTQNSQSNSQMNTDIDSMARAFQEFGDDLRAIEVDRRIDELNEALQAPLPSDDDEEEEDEDDDDDVEGAVGGITEESTTATQQTTTEQQQAQPQESTNASSSENQASNEGVVEENDGASGTTPIQEIDPAIRAILGDLEVPEGIDASFLAALPSEMREEVINEHLRQQRIRQRAQQTAALQEAQAVTEVNAEFLAALPPNIQEEVLAHQRLEQQRQAAAQANPNDPVNAAEFFQNLQPSLRQAVLTDMEDSQISALPPDLAAEAQNLRRDWESRNRQMLQERLLTSSFSSVFRYNNRNPRVYVPRHNFLQLNPSGSIALRSQPSHSTVAANMERQGAPLLDQESLASILVLLFIDDPTLITLRLYRVIRNLCFHIPTRKWIIRSLLSIIMRCNEESMDQYLDSEGSSSSSTSSRKSYREQSEEKVKWLKLRLDSALGGRANVFLKKLEKSNPPLTIHPKASPTVCRHVLELLIFLAKTFPGQFLPSRLPKPNNTNADDEPMPSTSQAAMYKDKTTDFWEILLRLDNEIDDRVKNKNLKAACKQIKEFTEQDIRTFNESPFGQLIIMLSYDIIRKNSLLTDKLLRLLSLISIVLTEERYKNPKTPRLLGGSSTSNAVDPTQPQTSSTSSTAVVTSQSQPQTQTTQQPQQPNIPSTSDNTKVEMVAVPEEDLSQTLPESKQHLSLAVQVLTSKSCSEDGLEDATSLLINLSQCSSSTKFMIINLLINGVLQLSHQVEKHIQNLMYELKELNESLKQEKSKESGTGTSSEDSDELSKPSTSRGQLKDRFTKDSVIITAPAKVKTTSCDLQLPSMAPLLSKISNQSFFLRILKVITQIRDTVRQDQKSCDPTIEVELNKLETVPLSELLNLDALWNTLSNCLKELEETQDHHAVLVLQPAVEAFFIVHSTPQNKNQNQGQGASGSGAGSSNNNNRINNTSTLRDNSINASQLGATGGTNPNPVENAENVVNNNNASSSDNVVRSSEPESANSTNNNNMNSVNNNPEPLETPPTQQQQQDNVPNQSAEEDVSLASRIEQPERPLSPMDTTQSNESSSSLTATTTTTTTTASTSSTATTSTAAASNQPPQPQPLSPNQKKFLQFAETHRVVLNQILRQSSTHLADGPFAVLVDHTRVLDFDVKRRYFRIELERLDDGVRREELAVHVHRVNVFEDSFRELYRRNPEEWKNRFYIVFEDEEGQDAGGLLREWYMIISREIFNPMYALFCVSPGDRVTYMINPASHCNPNHLCYFKFVGRVIAKAIYDNKLLECYFTRSFYKHILGIQVKYTDMESEDYAFYQGLVYLMENHVDTLGYDLTFSLEIQEFGVTEVRELIQNGGNIAVTEENKLEYIQLVCQLKMSGSIKQQLNAFLEGFYDIIPKRLISIFNEQELELLISGLPNIDIEDLRANTEYHKYQATSIQIQWFWRALRSFDQAERAKFLQFVTGTSKVPLQGFGSLEGMNGIQKFQIHRDDRSTDRLPSAHTCFNQLDLPVYKSYDKLRTNLLKAIHECSEGFGFA